MVYLVVMTVFIISLALTWSLRRYALAKNVLDIPNHRSSHSIPTPRGGGVAFVVAFVLAVPFVGYLGFVIMPVSVSLIVSGLLIAILGFLDDHTHVAQYWRLLGHFAASIFALYWLGGMPAISFLGWIIPAGYILNSLAVIYLVWMLNLYNFMDGIDGLAAIEAVSVCIAGAFLYWLNGVCIYMGLPLALAAAVTGFLCWNFPPARIFMGDAGSGFLGICLGILTVQAVGVKQQFFWSWLILLGVFIVDATITFLCRLFRGCRVYEAHRSHAYQHAARYFKSHLRVTLGVLFMNVFWLFPLAILVERGYLGGSTGLLIAYLPLIILAVAFKAGRGE